MRSLLVLFLFFIFANLPWISSRFLVFFPVKKEKSIFIRLLELGLYYFTSLGSARWVEHHYSGVIAPQQWEFYVITLCLFLVLSVPGLVYRYQWKKLHI